MADTARPVGETQDPAEIARQVGRLIRSEVVAAYEDQVSALRASYEAKVDDLRRETLRTEAALVATRTEGPVGMEGLGWQDAMQHVRDAVERASEFGSTDDPPACEQCGEHHYAEGDCPVPDSGRTEAQ